MNQQPTALGSRHVVEIRSYSDDQFYYIMVSGEFHVLVKLNLPFHENFEEIMKTSKVGYMPVQKYDTLGSNIRIFANDYVRITHVSNFSKAEEHQVICREQLSTLLFNDDWDLKGFTCHKGPGEHTSVVIEKWVKTV